MQIEAEILYAPLFGLVTVFLFIICLKGRKTTHSSSSTPAEKGSAEKGSAEAPKSSSKSKSKKKGSSVKKKGGSESKERKKEKKEPKKEPPKEAQQPPKPEAKEKAAPTSLKTPMQLASVKKEPEAMTATPQTMVKTAKVEKPRESPLTCGPS